MQSPWFESAGFGQEAAATPQEAGPAAALDPAGEAAAGQAAEIAGAAPAWPGQLLRLGSRGEAVSTVQGLLNRAGAGLDVDGDFGAKTQAAVLGAQRGAGLSADGVVGPQTWGLLVEGGAGRWRAIRPQATPRARRRPLRTSRQRPAPARICSSPRPPRPSRGPPPRVRAG